MTQHDLPTLIVGCSFVKNLNNPEYSVNLDRWTLAGSSGSGNQAIAARVLHECAQKNYREVIVIWSGINRLDFPVGLSWHRAMPLDSEGYPKYSYYSVMGDVVWYHSGGYMLSGCSSDSPDWFRNWCKTQYKSSSPRYLTDLSLQCIIQTQSFLKSQSIPYKMSFIYDIDFDYERHFTDGHRGCYIEPGCGKMDKSSDLVNLVNWSNFTSHCPPYEYAKSIDQLEDGFHPTGPAMIDWFNRALNIDLTA